MLGEGEQIQLFTPLNSQTNEQKDYLNINIDFIVVRKRCFKGVAYDPFQRKNEVKDGNAKKQSNIATNAAQQTGKLTNQVLFP